MSSMSNRLGIPNDTPQDIPFAKRSDASAASPSPTISVCLHSVRQLAARLCITLLIAVSPMNALAQATPPVPLPQPAFPKLFPKYTGMNGYEDLVIAGDLIDGNESIRVAELDDANLKQMRQALEDPSIARALAMVHLALDKPIQSPRDPDKLDEDTLLPEYAGFRRIARAMAIEEYVALADGRLAKAIETMRDGLRLGYVVQSETLLSGLVGVAIDAIALERLAHHYDQMALRDCIQLIGIAQEWLKLPSPAETVLTIENRCLHNMIDACKKDPARLRKLVKSLEPTGAPTSDSEVAALELSDYVNTNAVGMGAMLDEALALADTETRAQIAELRKPVWQRKPLPKFETRNSMAHRFCGLVIPAYNQALDKFDMDRAKMHLLGTHAAIHRFQWENNRLPATLAELKLPVLTTDPYTGQPLVFSPKSGSYDLYSAGSSARNTSGNGIAIGNGPIYLPRKPQ